MDKKLFLWVFSGLLLLTIVCLLCFKGITIKHDLDKKQTLTLPETVNEVEIPRKNGKEPFRFNIKLPERKVKVERQDQNSN